jgi:glucuronate isomerase
MRFNGVAERYCTGEAKPFEKFQAWAATVPHTVRNRSTTGRTSS